MMNVILACQVPKARIKASAIALLIMEPILPAVISFWIRERLRKWCARGIVIGTIDASGRFNRLRK